MAVWVFHGFETNGRTDIMGPVRRIYRVKLTGYPLIQPLRLMISFLVRFPRLAVPCACLLLAGGCATVPPMESRIARNPEMFGSLPESHQELVRQGRVKEGMSQDAVYLAWGRADEVRNSSRKGKALETWIYLGTEVIRRHTVGYGYGFGYGYCHGYGYGGPMFGVDYDYRNYVIARVDFDKGKVVYWEWNRRQR